MRSDRLATVVTLGLLQVFVLSAGAATLVTGLAEPAAPARPAAAPTPSAVPLVTSGPVLAPGDTAARATQVTTKGKAALAARLDGTLKGLAKGAGAVLLDARTGAEIYASDSGRGVTPASTTKLVTGTVALTVLGPQTRLGTRVVRGATKTSIVLVGGGDITLAGPGAKRRSYPRPASLVTLAARTARALKAAGVTRVTLGFDDSLFGGPRTGPGWKPGYVPEGTVSPVSALAINEGRIGPTTAERAPDPARAAADAFASLLAKYGVKVRDGAHRKRAAAGAEEIAEVHSPPVYQLVEHMLTVSDNDLAEALAHQVAVKSGGPATFAGATAAEHRVLRELGLDDGVTVYDGSGLSTRNRITPAALARILALAASPEHPELHSLITGLPIAGFTGTLDDRYHRAATRDGAGLVRAKTGTLNGVNTLAGIATTPTGRLVTFAFMSDKVTDPGHAVATLDRLATLAAGCPC
jgi:D-alanyl-D-alanine carboxypeptidase/D-alanyl-D-alanine-endopeptidase (penicillin-binding protein 4)